MQIQYFQVNLNKYDERTREQEKQRRSFISQVILIGLIFAGLFSVLIYFNLEVSKKIDARIDKLNHIKSDIVALEQKEKFISRADVFLLQELEEKRIHWAPKFGVIGSLLPKDTVIEDIFFRKNRMQIRGLSKIIDDKDEFNRIVQFMNRIKEDPAFAPDVLDIRFEESEKRTILKQNLHEFIITCYFR